MKFTAQKRADVGTSASKQLRIQDLVPGTIYGGKGEPINISMSKSDVQLIQRELGLNSVFELTVDGGTAQTVFVRTIETASIKPIIYNISLQAIEAGQKLEMPIPVHVVNEEEIADKDGIVAVNYYEINVIVDPAKAPENFTVDVAGKAIGDQITVADLDIPAGVEVLIEADEVVVSIGAPQEEAESSAEAAEPEVIGAENKAE